MVKLLACPEIGFEDSEFESFQMIDSQNILKIFLTSWDERELSLTFFNPIQFSYEVGDAISNFYEIQGNLKLHNQPFSGYFEQITKNQSFKLYQIWDINDYPVINVVAETVKVIKGTNIIGFRS